MVVLSGRVQFNGSFLMNFLTLLLCLFLMYSPTCQVTANCNFKVGNQSFDLSSLSQQPWRVKIEEEDVMYATVSLCNKTLEGSCGPVAVCITNQTNHYSGGDVMIVKEQQRGGSLTAVFEGNDPSKISTEITYICADKIGEPEYVSFESGHLLLTWESIAACPDREPAAHNSCSFSLPGGIQYINLQPLRRKEYYNTSVDGHDYYVNLCGGVLPNGLCGNALENVTVCDKTVNATSILGVASKQQVVTDGGLAIEYRNKSKAKRRTARIEIVCNASVETEILKFKDIRDNATHIFEIETPLGCVKGPIDCTVYDSNNYKYDLSALREIQHVVEDNRGKYKGYQYYLGICRPLNLTGDKNCSGGVSVCQKVGNSSLSLGTLSGGPRVDNEQVSLLYTGGAVCNSTHRYSTVINFVCDRTHQIPKLESVSQDCVYSFIWKTPSACPLTSSVGEDCRVYDKKMGYDFDLSSLRRKEDHVSHSTEGIFHINVCGPLVEACDGKNASVCFTDKRGTKHAIGEVATAPHYDDGRLSFVLEGETCNASLGERSTVIIIFNCGHSAKNNTSHPEYLVQGEGCRFYFLWQTDISCKEYKIFNCSVTSDDGETYDLSPLSQPTYNYIIVERGLRGGFRKFYINVCRSILFGHDSRCRPETGVCLYDLTEPNRQKSFTSLGEASGLRFDKSNKSLQLIYENGDICLENPSLSYRKSIITFACDPEDKGYSNPVLVKEGSCVHEFKWKTKYACRKNDGPKQDNCKYYISYSDTEYDFTPLSHAEHTVVNTKGQIFKLKACGSLVYGSSSKGAGVCYQKNEKECENWGMGNSKLIVDSGRVYLNYSNGAECAPNVKRNTVIEFVCGETNEGPHYVDEPSNCTHVFNWITYFACRRNVPCIAHSGKRDINLSLLINRMDNYNTTVNGSTYFINVCRPLVTKEGLHCYGGSAACRADFAGGKNWTSEVSLGYPHVSPQMIGNTVNLKYFSGSRCPNTTYLNYSTSIVFSCDPKAGIGGPTLVKFTKDCQYVFSWKTSVICEDNEVSITPADKNIFTNKQNNMTVNFTRLCSKAELRVEYYSVKLCDAEYLCSVYKRKGDSRIAYGTPQSVLFSYSDNRTKVFLSDGDECNKKTTDKNSAVVHFECGADEESLSVLMELDCRVELLLKTKTECYEREPSSIDEGKKVPASKRTVSIAGVIIGILVALIACGLVIFLRKAENRNWCRSKLCNLLNRRHQGQFHYSMLEASDEASGLLGSRGEEAKSDSDDDLLGV